MEDFIKQYKGYTLKYYFEPGKNQDDNNLNQIIDDLNYVNRLSKRNLEYGIFNEKLNFNEKKDFLNKIILCVFYLEKEPVGFFYQFLIESNKETKNMVCHLGLVLIAKNKGTNIMEYAYRYSILKIYEKYGKCYITNISAVPAIIGIVTKVYDKVWPSHNSKVRNPYKPYKKIVSSLVDNYAKKVFPNPDKIELDYHRFVLRLNSRECGFEDNFFKLPKYDNMPVNVFCYTWLDYNNGEEIVQVGELNMMVYIKSWVFIGIRGIYEF